MPRRPNSSREQAAHAAVDPLARRRGGRRAAARRDGRARWRPCRSPRRSRPRRPRAGRGAARSRPGWDCCRTGCRGLPRSSRSDCVNVLLWYDRRRDGRPVRPRRRDRRGWRGWTGRGRRVTPGSRRVSATVPPGRRRGQTLCHELLEQLVGRPLAARGRRASPSACSTRTARPCPASTGSIASRCPSVSPAQQQHARGHRAPAAPRSRRRRSSPCSRRR